VLRARTCEYSLKGEKVLYEHTYLPDSGVLLVEVSGLVDRPSWEDQLRASVAEASKHSCLRFLVDYRQADLHLGFLDLYNRPRFYEEAGIPKNARIALIFPAGAEDHEFTETVTANRGYTVKGFSGREPALEWLGQKPTGLL
jgi:hypothetical protein